MCNSVEIGKRIKSAREALGFTQEDLGKVLGMNKSTVQRYETGKVSKIKLPVIQSMAEVLLVNPAWLSLKSDDKDPPAKALKGDVDPDEFILYMYKKLDETDRIKIRSTLLEYMRSDKYKDKF